MVGCGVCRATCFMRERVGRLAQDKQLPAPHIERHALEQLLSFPLVRCITIGGAPLSHPPVTACGDQLSRAPRGTVESMRGLSSANEPFARKTPSAATTPACMPRPSPAPCRVTCCCGRAQAQNGATALHNAAGGGHAGVVRALLGAKADADVQNSNCNTALHLAAGKGARAAHRRFFRAGSTREWQPCHRIVQSLQCWWRSCCP